MQFRPCIDIHNGKVKQIVGSSLRDEGNAAVDNFVSEQDGAFYANMYKDAGIKGGHIILLNPPGSEYYEATKEQAISAMKAYPGGLQIGGGITADNARQFIEAGASHVIVTSYVFKDGQVNLENLEKLVDAVGREHVVLDLSCRYLNSGAETTADIDLENDTNSNLNNAYNKENTNEKTSGYYIVTDRWQKFTDVMVTEENLDMLADYCSEFLVHAVDVEGKASGIETNLVKLLGNWGKLPITYAGGVHTFEDLAQIYKLGNNKLNVTIGSALSIFGGNMEYDRVVDYCKKTL